MPRIANETIQKTCIYLKKIKVFTIGQLTSSLNCSVPCARLKLKQWKTYTSDNHNGRFYTLPTVPSFDENGLWRCHGLYFSKHGNLKATIIRLVNDSTSGLTGKQIGDLLGLSPQSFLHHFRYPSGMCREKHGGIQVYFSDNPATDTTQVPHRLKGDRLAEPSLSDTDAGMIRVAMLKHQGSNSEDLMAVPEIQARKFSAGVLREFLNRHGLLKKLRLPGVEVAQEIYGETSFRC